MPKKQSQAGQLALFDMSGYTLGELTGSHSDDLEDDATRKKLGKKSTFCPTWTMSPEELDAHRASYSDSVRRILARYPKAQP